MVFPITSPLTQTECFEYCQDSVSGFDLLLFILILSENVQSKPQRAEQQTKPTEQKIIDSQLRVNCFRCVSTLNPHSSPVRWVLFYPPLPTRKQTQRRELTQSQCVNHNLNPDLAESEAHAFSPLQTLHMVLKMFAEFMVDLKPLSWLTGHPRNLYKTCISSKPATCSNPQCSLLPPLLALQPCPPYVRALPDGKDTWIAGPGHNPPHLKMVLLAF